MQILNLCEAGPRQDIINRVNKLTADTKPLWGKMNVAQMLAHIQMPMGIGLGDHTIKTNFVLRTLGGMMKSFIYNDKPFKRNLPTAKSFIMTVHQKEFETEKRKALDMITRFTPENIRDKKHPVFGKLTQEQWGLANWKHIDHHLQQFGV
jgi:hypothetical protein